MSLTISSLNSPVNAIELPRPDSIGLERGTQSSPFQDILSGAIGQVEQANSAANQSVQQFLTGEGEDLHSTILSVQRADLEFQMMMQVRNKVISAYQEVMRMQM